MSALTKTKPGARANEQTGPDAAKHSKPNDKRTRTLKQRTKAFIVNLVLWGLLPIKAAEWLITRLRVGGA